MSTFRDRIGRDSMSAVDFSARGLTKGLVGRIAALEAQDTIINAKLDNIKDLGVSVMEEIPVALHTDIRALTSVVDLTTYIRSALTKYRTLVIPNGLYNISDNLPLLSGHRIIMSPGAIIKQTGLNKQIWYMSGKEDITFITNGALHIGEGTFKGGGDHYLAWKAWQDGGSIGPAPEFWTGNGGHDDRAFDLITCQNIRIFNARTQNCGHSGLAITSGCNDIRVVNCEFEGTNLHSTPIVNALVSKGDAYTYYANVQSGIYVQHNAIGTCDNLVFVAPEMRETTQGMLVESTVNTQPEGGIQVIVPVVHHIRGQHCFYLQSGNMEIVAPRMYEATLAGVKTQTTVDNNNIHITNITVTDANATNLGSSLFEIAHISGTGSISNCSYKGVGKNVLVGASLVGNLSNLRIDLNLQDTTANHVVMSGSGPMRNLDFRVNGLRCGDHGVVVTCTDMEGVRLFNPVIIDSGLTVAGSSGIISGGVNSVLEIYNPTVSGTSANYAISASHATSILRVHGKATLSPGTVGTIQSIGLVEGTVVVPYAPVLTASGTALTGTRHHAEYRRDGQIIEGCVRYAITGGSGVLYVPLPYPAKRAGGIQITAFENTATGRTMNASIREANLTRIEVSDTVVSGGGPALGTTSSVGAGRDYYVGFRYEMA